MRRPVPGGTITLGHDPSHAKPETTDIAVPHHGQGGEVDRPEQVVWFAATFGDCAGLRQAWSASPPTACITGKTRPPSDGPSDWFRALTGGGLGPGPSTRDPAGREVEVTRLDGDGLARLVAAMLALPGEAVEQFYAAWEIG